MTNNNKAKHQELGKEILAQKYETKYSSYVWEKPDEVNARMTFVEDKWKLLAELAAAKKKVLDEDLARELEKERLRFSFSSPLITEYKIRICWFGFRLYSVDQGYLWISCYCYVWIYFGRSGSLQSDSRQIQCRYYCRSLKLVFLSFFPFKNLSLLKIESNKTKSAFTSSDAKMKELGVKENVYTKITLDDLAASEAKLNAALEGRLAQIISLY